MEREFSKFQKAEASFRQASIARADDRNQRAGDLYEAQKALNNAVEAKLANEYAASWLDRWTV